MTIDNLFVVIFDMRDVHTAMFGLKGRKLCFQKVNLGNQNFTLIFPILDPKIILHDVICQKKKECKYLAECVNMIQHQQNKHVE